MHSFTRPSPLSDEYKTPAGYVETTNIETASGSDSPPLTSSLHSRNSASSADEESYLRKALVLKWLRLGLAVVVTGISIAAVGVSSHVLRNYNGTHLDNGWNLALWPLNVDVRPTVGTLVPAAIAAMGALIYVAFALIPSPHSRFQMQNIVFAGVSTAASITCLSAVVFTYVTNDGSRDTIQTWTCFFTDGAKQFAADSALLGIPQAAGPLIPAGFERVCINSQTARWLMVTLFVLELVSVIVALVGLIVDRRISKVRRSRYERDEKSSMR